MPEDRLQKNKLNKHPLTKVKGCGRGLGCHPVGHAGYKVTLFT